MTIGDVARQAGVAPSAIRWYERAGLLPATPRARGRRVYAPEVLDRLAFIMDARGLGFSLAEIAELVAPGRGRRGYSPRMRALARRKLDELEAWLGRARRVRAVLVESLACDCLDVTTCGRHLRAARIPAPPPAPATARRSRTRS